MGLFDRLRRPSSAAPPPVLPKLPAAQEAVDQLVLAHGLGWSSLTCGFGKVAGKETTLTSSDVRFPATPTDMPEALPLDPTLQAPEISRAFAHLAATLASQGASWSGVGARCEWVDSHIELSLLGKRDHVEQRLTVEPSALQFGADFHRAIERLGPKMEARQRPLETAIAGFASKAWDRATDPEHLRFTMTDGSTCKIPATPLGSWSPQAGSWCWSWANRDIEPELTLPVARLRSSSPALAALSTGGFPCQEGLAPLLASLAADRLGERPIFAFHTRSGLTMYFAVEPPSA